MAEEKQTSADEQTLVDSEEKEAGAEVQAEDKTGEKSQEKKDESKVDSLESLRKKLEEKEKMEAGLNRKVSTVEKERDGFKEKYEELKRQQMSEEERLEAEKKDFLREKEEARKETEKYKNDLMRTQVIHSSNHDAQILASVARGILSNDEGQVKASVDALDEYMDIKFKSREENLNRFGSGKAPKTGESVKPSLLELEDNQVSGLQDEEFEKKYNELLKRHKK